MTVDKELIQQSGAPPLPKPIPDSDAREKVMRRWNLVASPAGLLVFASLWLPWLSISCDNQKMVSHSGADLVTNGLEEPASNPGLRLDPPFRQRDERFLPFSTFMVPLLLCGAAVSVMGTILFFNWQKAMSLAVVGVCLAGLAITISTGAYFGVYVESELRGDPVKLTPSAVDPNEQSSPVMVPFDIEVQMDAGYYLTLAVFIASLAAVAMGLIAEGPPSGRRSPLVSVVGCAGAIAAAMCLAAMTWCLLNPADESANTTTGDLFGEISMTCNRH